MNLRDQIDKDRESTGKLRKLKKTDSWAVVFRQLARRNAKAKAKARADEYK